MISLKQASIADLNTIQEIANITWPITYGEILSKEQLNYMMDLIYSDESLIKQIQKKEQLFYIVNEETSILAFIAIEHNYKNEAVTRIHKIYILPEAQGKGIGKILIDAVQKLATENKSTSLSLNVNRFNKALAFYQKLGFEIIAEENIEIGNGYLMEDYKMEKKL
ncbi:GNAT family N-acetyltransferase [Flavobacterium sp. LB2P74]|uniref:GNAT family N-acetyltransferase n=1 Tax=Flavobacterium sp. LB2P74 TaxID=3401717 RepID=UPI003AAFB4BA